MPLPEASLATGYEDIWLRLADLHTATDGGQVLDGSTLKSVMVDAQGTRYFTKRYHEILQPRDAVYEFLGQRIAARAGFAAAATFLGEESPLYILSRDFLSHGERLVTLRTFRLQAIDPEGVIRFFAEAVDAARWAAEVCLLDAIISNRGRHTGNLALIANAKGEYLRVAPLFDTVAFDDSGLWQAAKNSKERWLKPSTSSGLEYRELASILRRHFPGDEFERTVECFAAVCIETVEVLHGNGVVSERECAYILKLVSSAVSGLLA